MSDTIPDLDLTSGDETHGDQPARVARHAGLTWQEGKRHGLTRRQHRQIVADARIIARHHTNAGIPEHEREPLPMHAEHIVSESLEGAREYIVQSTEKRIDPKLIRIEQALESTRSALRDAEELPARHRRKEAGTTHTGAAAVGQVVRDDIRIAQDNAASLHHHRRHHGLRIAGLMAPWLDVIGLIAFATFVLDVPVLAPWENWFDWLLGMAIVVGVGLASAFTAMHAGHAHNAAREAMADGHIHEAEELCRRRNLWLIALGGLAALLAATLYARTQVALDGLGDDGAVMSIVLAALAIAAAFGLLAIAYLGTALDGSRLSRERDAMTKSLVKDHRRQEAAKRAAAEALDQVNLLANQIRLHDAPSILEDAQTILLAGRQRYERTRLHIGDVTTDVAPVPHRVIKQIGDTWQGELSTGVEGASTVALEPLLDRETRLRKLMDDREALTTELAAIPEHPWTRLASLN